MRPFEGMKVVDLTHVLAGPFSTYQLALLGADVVKIEAPGLGEYMRRRGADEAFSKNLMGDHYLSQNANKRSLVVNLKTSRGQDVVRRLVAGADVVVENYRAGVVDRLNLGYEALAALNPRLVYCSLKAYGATGPKGGLPGWDHNVQAASGLMMTTGTESSAPLKAGAPVIDYASGTMAAFAISAALLQRERTGKGQFIDVSMLDTALMLMSPLVGSCFMTGRAPKSLTRNEFIDFKPLRFYGRGAGCWRSEAMLRRFRWFPRSPWRGVGCDRTRRTSVRRPIVGATARSLWPRPSA